ncbi:hypothetical protein EJ08DRAFT_725958 [Tothia fuscella]|uniref:Uncharacterized protein n=1 Tax=Tothia fuscella TaxID=1048955 RepID=A0A9P4TU20_9PEZI|nr:hypothetical protein EJ08DRAFT_725958 [Tothia fuscella]
MSPPTSRRPSHQNEPIRVQVEPAPPSRRPSHHSETIKVQVEPVREELSITEKVATPLIGETALGSEYKPQAKEAATFFGGRDMNNLKEPLYNSTLPTPMILGWNTRRNDDPNHSPKSTASLSTPPESFATITILREIEDWLDLHDHDGLPASNRYNRSRIKEMDGEIQRRATTLLPDITTTLENSASIIHCIAIQLLASCYTTHQISLADSTLPSALYTNRAKPPMISALRMHSQYRLSPSSGYHARDTSPAPAWPGLYTGPSPEERLAEALTKKRREEQSMNDQESMRESIERNCGKIYGFADGVAYQPRRLSQEVDLMEAGVVAACDGSASLEGEYHDMFNRPVKLGEGDSRNIHEVINVSDAPQIKARPDFWFRKTKNNTPNWPDKGVGEDYEMEEGHSSTSPIFNSPTSSRKASLSTWKGKGRSISPEKQHKPTQSKSGRKWSLKPILKSEPHPLFVQPVKDYVIQRPSRVRHRRRVPIPVVPSNGAPATLQQSHSNIPQGGLFSAIRTSTGSSKTASSGTSSHRSTYSPSNTNVLAPARLPNNYSSPSDASTHSNTLSPPSISSDMTAPLPEDVIARVWGPPDEVVSIFDILSMGPPEEISGNGRVTQNIRSSGGDTVLGPHE